MRSVIRKFGVELPDIVYPLRDDGKVDICPVDAFAGQTFNINQFGHIKSDVSALMEAQSQSEKDLIAQRLVEAQGSNPDLSGLTDSDIFKYSQSRYYQTPAEVQQFAESLAKAQDARAIRLKKEADAKAAFEKEKAEADAFNNRIAEMRKAGKIDDKGNIVDSKSV